MSLKSKYMFSHSVVSDSCDSMDCTLPGSSVHVISQATILEWIAISSFWGSIFSTQGLNPSLLHWQMDSLPLNHQGSPQGQGQGQGQRLNLSSIPTPDPAHASDMVLVYSWWMNEILNKQNEWMTGRINLHKAISRNDRVNVMAASKRGMNLPFSASKCLNSKNNNNNNYKKPHTQWSQAITNKWSSVTKTV